MDAKIIGVGSLMIALAFAGCETSTQTTRVSPDAGLLKKMSPAVVLDGSDAQFNGLVKVSQVDQERMSASFLGSTAAQNREIALQEGTRKIALESSFNREGQLYVFEADLSVDVQPARLYYPVAGFEVNTGKAWMWIQDNDHQVRASDRVEGRLVKQIQVAKANYLEDRLEDYASIIDPEVLADRKAACDFTQAAGYMPDTSLDRGDLTAAERSRLE